ncbi:MAG: 4Fe-4S dicluster domain-containing protein [Deltaproteobacteria bacterium]|nr:4Fe-4S dicluster domain-containing protein [Deltaproteobacteria bacterium]
MDLEPITLRGEPRESALGRAVVAESDVNVNLCYQCRKCAAGCPLAEHMDLTPTQVIHAVRLGQRDMVLKSKTIWLCISCETCTTRCPQGVDVARVMDAARIAAIREGVEPAIPEVAVFHKKAMKNIGRHGRMYELGLIMGLKLAGGGLTKDMALGMQLFKKGKIRLLPSFGKSSPVKRIMKRAGEKKGEGG